MVGHEKLLTYQQSEPTRPQTRIVQKLCSYAVVERAPLDRLVVLLSDRSLLGAVILWILAILTIIYGIGA